MLENVHLFYLSEIKLLCRIISFCAMVFDFTIVQFGEIILSYLIFERLNNLYYLERQIKPILAIRRELDF